MCVRYDGTDFHGSQLQRGQRTVSGTLTTELNSLLGQTIRVLWAGRTDTGVHADANVCSFDANLPMPVDHLAKMLNSALPPDMRIVRQWQAAADFHPRFDAVQRCYTYRIWLGQFAPVDRYRYVYEYSQELDVNRLLQLSRLFTGEHCFLAFSRKMKNDDLGFCNLQDLDFQVNGQEIRLVIRGNRFLRHMICRIVGALLAICEERLTEAEVGETLRTGRELKLKPAPARGLTLTGVDYQRSTLRQQELI
jgi:tRNA pseudouridine38-40 synthase